MNKEAVEYYRSLSSSVETFCQPLSEYLGISLFIYFILIFILAGTWYKEITKLELESPEICKIIKK